MLLKRNWRKKEHLKETGCETNFSVKKASTFLQLSYGSSYGQNTGKSSSFHDFKGQRQQKSLTVLQGWSWGQKEMTTKTVPTPGGRLLLYYQVWRKNACHPRVVHILQWGYKIILREPVKLSTVPIIHSGYTNREKQKFLQDSVTQMLKKKVVVPVRMCRTLGFYSRLFLVPKPGKKWRPVIHLSVHLSVPTFKVETAEFIRNAICKGEWVVFIDLTDAYFHIPIHNKYQHILRFHVAGQTYQFQALPFGIAMAPLEFTRVVKEVHQYLDDWLLRAPSEEICLKQSKLVAFVQELGWVINFQKSELKPTQNFDCLGYRFDLVSGEASPTEKK